MPCLARHPCVLAHTAIAKPLSPRSRDSCSSVGSVSSEREQLILKRSPTQVRTNSAVLQHNVVLIFFCPSSAFHTNFWELFWGFQGRNWFSYCSSTRCLGVWNTSHWGFLRFLQSYLNNCPSSIFTSLSSFYLLFPLQFLYITHGFYSLLQYLSK